MENVNSKHSFEYSITRVLQNRIAMKLVVNMFGAMYDSCVKLNASFGSEISIYLKNYFETQIKIDHT